MRIVVPIKQVPETNAVKMDEATGTMIREGVEAIINPLDLYAIEAAIQLREAAAPGSVEVVALSMGPPKAAVALKEAIAMGIDSAVLVSDKALPAATRGRRVTCWPPRFGGCVRKARLPAIPAQPGRARLRTAQPWHPSPRHRQPWHPI